MDSWRLVRHLNHDHLRADGLQARDRRGDISHDLNATEPSENDGHRCPHSYRHAYEQRERPASRQLPVLGPLISKLEPLGNGRQQLSVVERFGEVVTGAQSHRGRCRPRCLDARDHNDGDPARQCAHVLEYLKSAGRRQLQIQHDDVGPMSFKEGERRFTVARLDDLMMLIERQTQRVARRRVVVDDQDPRS